MAPNCRSPTGNHYSYVDKWKNELSENQINETGSGADIPKTSRPATCPTRNCCRTNNDISYDALNSFSEVRITHHCQFSLFHSNLVPDYSWTQPISGHEYIAIYIIIYGRRCSHFSDAVDQKHAIHHFSCLAKGLSKERQTLYTFKVWFTFVGKSEFPSRMTGKPLGNKSPILSQYLWWVLFETHTDELTISDFEPFCKIQCKMPGNQEIIYTFCVKPGLSKENLIYDMLWYVLHAITESFTTTRHEWTILKNSLYWCACFTWSWSITKSSRRTFCHKVLMNIFRCVC